MRSRFIGGAMLSAFVLTSPWLTFAADQPAKMHRYSKSEMQDRTGMTRALQQGKGAGMTRYEVVLRGNAYRLQTVEQSTARKDESGAPSHSNRGDSAFRK